MNKITLTEMPNTVVHCATEAVIRKKKYEELLKIEALYKELVEKEQK